MSTVKTNGVVNKLTKEQLTVVLRENFKAVKKASKEVAERITYASKSYKEDEKSVTKKDLLDLVKETMTVLGDKFILATDSTDVSVPVLAENSVKPSGKKLSKKSKTEPKEEEPKTEETDEEPKEEAPKKTAKKSSKKESAVTPKEAPSEYSVLLAEVFKDTIETEGEDGVSKYAIAHDIQTMEDLMKAFENEETIVFAFYWTERHLKQFEYFSGWVKAPKSFPMDLDLASCIFASDDGVIAYAVSLYTDANYNILPEDLEEVDGIRFCRGMEFQIYRLVE